MPKSRVLLLAVVLALLASAVAWLVRAREDAAGPREVDAARHGGAAPPLAGEEPAAATPPLLGAASGPGRSALAAADAPVARAPIRLRLLDQLTAEPVPWFLVSVSADVPSEVEAESDAEGRITTPAEFAPGDCWVSLLDFHGQARQLGAVPEPVRVPHVHGAAAIDVTIRIGPTFRIDVDLPPGYGSECFLVGLQSDPTEFGDDRRGELWPRTRLRAPATPGALPWARFTDVDLAPQITYLLLLSDDGRWIGGARVGHGYGVHRDPVRIVLEPRCAVTGRYVTRGAELDRAGAALALFQVGGDAPGPRWEFKGTDSPFRIGDLAPGRYRLEVRDDAVRAAPVEFTLTRGELDLGELVWEPIPVAGPVRLRVLSAIEVPIDVELVRTKDPPRDPQWHSDQWEARDDGTFESLFEWEAVRAGEFEVAVHAHDAAVWHVSLGRITPPVEDLVLRLPKPAPALRLEVLDDATGAALAEWSVLVRQEGGWDEVEDDPAAIRSAVWDADAVLAVVSPGHQAAFLTPAALERPAAGEWRARVRLKRGWSGLFLVRARSREKPVAGAEIVLDGAVAGVTDAAGEVWIHRPSPPAAFDVRHPTLVLADGVEFDSSEPLTWIPLRRR
jgi:hypothetical protein